jgi:hypothetical protein
MVSQRRSLRNIRRFLFGLGWIGSGAMLDVPGPVGGVVLGCMTGASRDVPEESRLSGAGGPLGTSEAGMVPSWTGEGFDGLNEGDVVGAGLGTTVSPRLLLSSA